MAVGTKKDILLSRGWWWCLRLWLKGRWRGTFNKIRAKVAQNIGFIRTNRLINIRIKQQTSSKAVTFFYLIGQTDLVKSIHQVIFSGPKLYLVPLSFSKSVCVCLSVYVTLCKILKNLGELNSRCLHEFPIHYHLSHSGLSI